MRNNKYKILIINIKKMKIKKFYKKNSNKLFHQNKIKQKLLLKMIKNYYQTLMKKIIKKILKKNIKKRILNMKIKMNLKKKKNISLKTKNN